MEGEAGWGDVRGGAGVRGERGVGREVRWAAAWGKAGVAAKSRQEYPRYLIPKLLIKGIVQN